MPGYNPIPQDGADKKHDESLTDITSPYVITHSLSKRPSVTFIDEDEEKISIDVDFDADGDPLNTVTLLFNCTLSGRVICN